MFGGEEDAIRGYVGGQYRDKVSLTTQVEYRLRVYKKWGLVAFAGVGQVAPQVDEIEFDDLLPSGGILLASRARMRRGSVAHPRAISHALKGDRFPP